MKAATLNELKAELNNLPPAQVEDLCIRLVRFKKENKELLTYLLFESTDNDAFVEGIKKEVDIGFEQMNTDSLYYIKKSVRKILRLITRYSRYASSDKVTAELLLYFCHKLKNAGLGIEKSQQMVNLYAAQIKKIEKLISSMHEDLQYDYRKELDEVSMVWVVFNS